jgi:hypothetical protein
MKGEIQPDVLALVEGLKPCEARQAVIDYWKDNLPASDKGFRRMSMFFFGVPLSVEKLQSSTNFVTYKLGVPHEEYGYTPHTKALAGILFPRGIYDLEGFFCRMVFGELSCGGIAGTNYGQAKPDTVDVARIEQWIRNRLNAVRNTDLAHRTAMRRRNG